MNKTEIINEITQGVNNRINSKKVAYQFILEELDAARQGNDEAMLFIQDSGFSESEYIDAIQNSFEEVDGVNGPQQFLLNSVMPYASNMDLISIDTLFLLLLICSKYGDSVFLAIMFYSFNLFLL